MAKPRIDFEDTFREPLRKLGVDLIEVEWKKEGKRRVLRFYIDSKAGISIDDCERASRMLSDQLDLLDPIDEPYYLEVSSLGLERAMKKDRELENAIGKKVVLRFYGTVDNQKELVGEFTHFTEEVFGLLQEDEIREFLRKDVSTIRKYVQW